VDNIAIENIKRPAAIIIRGMPGSGKSYLAAALKRAIGDDLVVTLDPDATDYESQEYKAHVKAQIAEGVDPKLHAYRFLRAKAYKAIEERKIIIWNQAFTNLEIFNKMVGRLRYHASLHKVELPILVVEIDIHPATAKERIAARKRAGGHGVSDDTFARFTVDYRSFASEGFDTVTVHGEADVSDSVATVIEAIRKS
jgi:predicted kinase